MKYQIETVLNARTTAMPIISPRTEVECYGCKRHQADYLGNNPKAISLPTAVARARNLSPRWSHAKRIVHTV